MYKWTTNKQSTLVSILFLAFMTACSGGGSDGPTPVVNQPPTVDAGAEISADEQTEVSLIGSGTDSDGTIASYSWSQTSGSNVTLNGSDNATATFMAPDVVADEVLTFQLTVTDNGGASATDTVGVTIIFVNQLPTITGIDSSYLAPALSRLDISATVDDADGDSLSVTWQQLSGVSLWQVAPTGTDISLNMPADIGEEQSIEIQIDVSDGHDIFSFPVEIIIPTSTTAIVTSETEYGELDDLDPEPESDLEVAIDSINSLGILEYSANSFKLTLTSTSGVTLEGEIEITIFSNQVATDISEFFDYDSQLNEITIRQEKVADFFGLLGGESSEIIVNSSDSAGISFSKTITFLFGVGQIDGTLIDATGAPFVDLEGETIELRGSFKGNALEALVDSDGSFQFIDLPTDTYNLTLFTSDLKIAHSSILITLNNSSVSVTPAVIDLTSANPEPKKEQNSDTKVEALDSEFEVVDQQRLIHHNTVISREQAKSKIRAKSGAELLASISTVSAGQGQSIYDNTAIEIPAEITEIKVVATVDSAEFPTYTTVQSEFNDAWQFNYIVGSKVESKQGNVNSSHASTGTISFSKAFEVNQGNGAATSVTLFVSATNIGDSVVPTTVTLEVYKLEEELTVNQFRHKDGLGFGNGRWHIGVGTNSHKNWSAIVEYSPKDSELTSAECNFVTATQSFSLANTSIESITAGRAKLNMGFSGLATTPSTSTHGKVECTFEANSVENSIINTGHFSSMEMSAGKDDLIPLTRYSSGSRYGTRDMGNDDWMRARARNYLAGSGSSLIYNDASREHGGCFVKDSSYNIYNTSSSSACGASIRDHQTHRAGTSLDTLYPTTFISPADLKSKLAQANTNPTVASELKTWVVESRSGIDAVALSTDVKKIYVAKSSWMYNLLYEGIDEDGITVSDLVQWTTKSIKVVRKPGHRDHIHVEFHP